MLAIVTPDLRILLYISGSRKTAARSFLKGRFVNYTGPGRGIKKALQIALKGFLWC